MSAPAPMVTFTDKKRDRSGRWLSSLSDRRPSSSATVPVAVGLLLGVVETAEQSAGTGTEACRAALPLEGHRQSRPIAATTPNSLAWCRS